MPNITNNHKGQSFIEFVFLLVIMMSMAFLLLNGVNTGISDRWKKFVAIISENDSATIRFNNE